MQREAKKGFGDEIPKQVWAAAQNSPIEKVRIAEEPELSAASGGSSEEEATIAIL